MGLFDDTPKPALSWADPPKTANTWTKTNASDNPQKQSARFEIETDVPAPQPKATKAPNTEARETLPPQLRQWPIPTADFKPGIDMAIAVFRNYLRLMSRAEMPDSLRNPEQWEAQAARNKEQLEEDLKGLGLAQYINFDE